MQKVRSIPLFGALALLVYMPFHVFLVQFLSSITGGLNAWKVGVDVFTLLLTVFTICLVWRQGRAPRTFWTLVWLTAAWAAMHVLLWATHPHIYRPSAEIGTAYNVRILCFAVIGYGAVLLRPGNVSARLVMKIILAVSTLVAILGIIQFFLPSNFLAHFGYSTARGARPAFFIDNNDKYLRVMATLRDPNSFGAYLVLPITFLVERLLAKPMRRARTWYAAMLAVQLLALGLTFSRSAWLAILLSLGLLFCWRYRAAAGRIFRRWWPVLAIGLVLLTAGVFAERHTPFVKSYIIHSTGKPQGQYDSDGFHWYFVKRGVLGIWHDPLGHGPGTAGLASIQNPNGGLLTENYYVQVGYELGVIGLALFVAINAFVYRQIMRRGGSLKVLLLATFWGYVVINMLLHGWSNEAVAAQWWILAGMAMAGAFANKSSAKKPAKKKK